MMDESYGRSPAMLVLPIIREENRKNAYDLAHWDEPGVQEAFYARHRITWALMGLIDTGD